MKNLGRFIHDSFPPSMPNALTEFYADAFGIFSANELRGTQGSPSWALGTVVEPDLVDWSAVAGSCSSAGGVRGLLGASTFAAYGQMVGGYWLGPLPPAQRKAVAFHNIEAGLMLSIATVPDYAALPDFVAAVVSLRTTCPGTAPAPGSTCFDYVSGYLLGGLLSANAAAYALTQTGQVYAPCAP
ncbi:MAG: hypothetical protein IT380_28735 [Myxococcales bacterium]|nr:hypothetical protein [Myxococcales bacterium]